jgi:hypothetical protein
LIRRTGLHCGRTTHAGRRCPTGLRIDPRVYATDVDSTVFTTQIVTGPAHGVLTANPYGSYVYTPDADFNGAAAIAVDLLAIGLIGAVLIVTRTGLFRTDD